MQKLKLFMMISLAFLVLGGCSAANEEAPTPNGNEDQAVEGEVKPVNVKARYVSTNKKQQVLIEAISAHFTVYTNVVVKFSVEGSDAKGKSQKETLEANFGTLNQGEIKEKIVHTKKIETPEKVKIISVTGIE